MIDTHVSITGGDGAGSVQGSIMAFELSTLRRGAEPIGFESGLGLFEA